MSNLNTSTGHYEYGMDMSPQLSLTDGDWCEDGTWSVIFAIGTFVLFVLFHQVMYFYKGRCTNNKGTEPNTHVEYQNQGRSLTESMIERVFVAPFVPKKLETLVALIFGAWFMMTIPMAFTRYFEGWWGQQLLTQQGPFNLMANAIGCKGLDMNAIKYAIQAPQDQEQKEVVRLGSHAALAQPERVLFPQESPEEQEFASAESSVNAAPKSLGHSPDIDYYFALHLFFGMVWLTMGGIQIYLAKNGWSVSSFNSSVASFGSMNSRSRSSERSCGNTLRTAIDTINSHMTLLRLIQLLVPRAV
uniref:Uncharacterized protein n=1 Tax=Entomoneis paludosa TaxID=265537 RepID=A0A6U2ZGN3_9STRA|mmetsp:Transcript_20046/g.41937  ORF Transcript_20046/g.41937 Transcript_20046/m.41937 type:complete len:302 (+) Transcript_20046:150-1055(+)